MARSLTLPTVGILALLGAGAGVHLGRSAIAEINPAHFKWAEKSSSFYADLTPNSAFDSAPRTLVEEESPALGSGCIGCRTYPEEYHPIHDPAVDGFETVQSVSGEVVPVQLTAYAAELPEEIARRMADQARIELYARAPTTTDEQVVYAVVETMPVEESEGVVLAE